MSTLTIDGCEFPLRHLWLPEMSLSSSRTGRASATYVLSVDRDTVLSSLAGAYEQWISQGADAFRIDTIAWMPDEFWQRFTSRIRSRHPGFFMFGEAFDFDAEKIAHHTWKGHGETSVLDFPLKERMAEVFGRKGAGFERIAERLYLENGPCPPSVACGPKIVWLPT